MKKDKLYYNTEYRKQIKALSKFNIFIKDRVNKADEIQEIKLKKNITLVAPIIYKNAYSLYKLIQKSYNRWVYKATCNIKLSLDFYISLYIFKESTLLYLFLKNQLVLEYFSCGIIYFFSIIN